VKVLGIAGSPRKEGVSAQLLKEALAAAHQEGAETEIVYLIDYPIRPCLGCYSDDPADCDPRRCTHGELEDGMAGLHQKILWADALIIATPTYWFGPSGLVKSFVDRLTSLENVEKYLDGMPAGVIAACEEDGAVWAAAQLAVALNWMGCLIPPYGLVYSQKGDPESFADARRLGRNVAFLARFRGSRDYWKAA